MMIQCTIVTTVILCLFISWTTSQKKKHALKKEVNQAPCNYVRGDIRLSKGMYRTPEEADKYIEASLKRPLP